MRLTVNCMWICGKRRALTNLIPLSQSIACDLRVNRTWFSELRLSSRLLRDMSRVLWSARWMDSEGTLKYAPRRTGASQSADQRPYHVFLLWASDPPHHLFLAQIGSISGFTSAPAIADVLTWPRYHDRGSHFSGQDCVSGHLLVNCQVKHLLDLDFIDFIQTRVRRTTKTRKETPEIFCGPQTPHRGKERKV